MTFAMPRKIIRLVMAQRKFISRSSGADHREMMLYNEMPQKSKSLIIRYDDSVKKELYQSNEVKNISSANSRLFFLFNSNCFVFYRDTEKTVPVIEDRIDDQKIPEIRFKNLFKWYAKTKDSGDKDPPGQTGARLGRLDAANEAGFFHRTDRSRLKQIKKQLKSKGKGDPTEPKKTA